MTDDLQRITLLDEDGQPHEFSVWDAIEVDGEQYLLLVPVESGDDGEQEEAYVFRVQAAGEEGEQVLIPVEDDEELARVARALEAAED
ncbi:MAG: DUF1292 domain-containing protein [Firmicutes bacterium]|nr:DUF1292 domain-containing protein [Bacillota bacterium]